MRPQDGTYNSPLEVRWVYRCHLLLLIQLKEGRQRLFTQCLPRRLTPAPHPQAGNLSVTRGSYRKGVLLSV